MLFDEGSALSNHYLRGPGLQRARTIGERFRGGTPVIMDLVSMDNADAAARRPPRDWRSLRVVRARSATKGVPAVAADVGVTEERRRMAEAGFYAQ